MTEEERGGAGGRLPESAHFGAFIKTLYEANCPPNVISPWIEPLPNQLLLLLATINDWHHSFPLTHVNIYGLHSLIFSTSTQTKTLIDLCRHYDGISTIEDGLQPLLLILGGSLCLFIVSELIKQHTSA